MIELIWVLLCYIIISVLFRTGRMMSIPELAALTNAAMALSQSERAKLAKTLVASLAVPAEKGVAEAWDIEICHRINEIEAGTADLLDVDEILSRIRARIGT